MGLFKPSDKGGAYTEIVFHVNTIVANDTTAHVIPGATIDIGEVGGSIKESDGLAHKYNLLHPNYVMQPGHSYLVQLSYVADGDFYLADRKWDITSGEAVADGDTEVETYINGTAQVGGLPAQDAIRKAAQIVKAQQYPLTKSPGGYYFPIALVSRWQQDSATPVARTRRETVRPLLTTWQ